MSIENLKTGLPEYAKDLKLNLGSLARSTELNEQQLWGSLLTAAATTRNDTVLSEIADEAREHLSEEAFNAALAAASIMAMNNVAYRARGWLGENYAQVRMGLRMNVIGKPGVDQTDFELWSTVASVINGCEHCTHAHEAKIREEGLSKEQVWEAIKIAATVAGVAQAIQVDAAL